MNGFSYLFLNKIFMFKKDFCSQGIENSVSTFTFICWTLQNRGGDWDSGGSCNGETEPVLSGAILDNYPLKMKIVEETIKEMRVPVILLNVTRLTNFRKDGHPSIYGKNHTAARKVSTRRQDCSHWCLPGVPDAWNELIYAALVSRSIKSKFI